MTKLPNCCLNPFIPAYHFWKNIGVFHLKKIRFNPDKTGVWEALPGPGEGSGGPPIYLGSRANFCSKIMFPQKLASIPTHLAAFQNSFSKNHKTMGENWKSIKTFLKMSENSKICYFWEISTCNTSKESIFHIEFNFT